MYLCSFLLLTLPFNQIIFKLTAILKFIFFFFNVLCYQGIHKLTIEQINLIIRLAFVQTPILCLQMNC